MPRGGMRYDGGIGICISVKVYFNRIFRFTLFYSVLPSFSQVAETSFITISVSVTS